MDQVELIEKSNFLLLYNKHALDKKALNCTDSQLIRRQDIMLPQAVRIIEQQSMLALQRAFTGPACTLPQHEKEFMTTLLKSKDMIEVANGDLYSKNAIAAPWSLYIVKAYLSIKMYYENVNESSNVNFCSELLEVVKMAENGSISERILRFRKSVQAIADTCSTVDEFLDRIEASMEYG
eukprot:3413205-Rhodomonas_salina.1